MNQILTAARAHAFVMGSIPSTLTQTMPRVSLRQATRYIRAALILVRVGDPRAGMNAWFISSHTLLRLYDNIK